MRIIEINYSEFIGGKCHRGFIIFNIPSCSTKDLWWLTTLCIGVNEKYEHVVKGGV